MLADKLALKKGRLSVLKAYKPRFVRDWMPGLLFKSTFRGSCANARASFFPQELWCIRVSITPQEPKFSFKPGPL